MELLHSTAVLFTLFSLTTMLLSMTQAKTITGVDLERIGPQPYTKNSPSPLAIPPTDENNAKLLLEQNILNPDLTKYKNLDDEKNQLNLTLNLLPSFNNDTSSVLISPKKEDNTLSPPNAPVNSDLVQKPSGTLYVDSIHNFQDRSSPLGMPDCALDEDFDEDDGGADPYQLSASEFGFPKSIVDKALEDSPFKSALNILIKLKNYKRNKQQNSNNSGENRRTESSNHFNPYPGFAASTSNSLNYNDVPHSKDSLNRRKTYSPFQEGNAGTKQNDIINYPFPSSGGYQRGFDSFNNNVDSADSFAPHLLEGSVFSSASKPSENNKNPNNTFDNSIDNNPFSNKFSLGNNNYNFDDNSKINSYGNNNFNSKTFDNNIEADSQVDDESSNQQQRDKTTTKTTTVNSTPKSQTTDDIDAGENTNEVTTKNNNLFSKFLPDVSGGNSWSSPTNEGPNSYYGFGSQSSRPYQYQGKAKLSGMIKTLFPPKKSESLPEISGLKDLIPKSNPVIKYSDKQKSNVESPFDLNIQSIIGSISGSRLGLGRESPSSKYPGNTQSRPAASSNFGFVGGRQTPTYKNYNGGSPTLAKVTGDFNQIRFAEYRTRRKRDTRETCETTHSTLRQYQNHGGACFVVLPDVQEILFATCPRTPCSDCAVNGGSSQCQPVKVPMWVWSYCEAGPNGGSVAPDLLDVPVACKCKVRYCRRVPLGRS